MAKDGLDETRRLLYMALLRRRTEKYELAGTLVNALAHHHGMGDPEEITDHVLMVIEGNDVTGESAAWLRDRIARITAELGKSPPVRGSS